MKRIALALCLAATPCLSETPADPPADPEVEQGFSLMEEGAKLLLRGLASRMEPALKDMGAAMAEMEPKLREVLALIDDLRNYHAPERLENGDILIRRKTPAELQLEGLEGPATDL
jgi:hypothetical protein